MKAIREEKAVSLLENEIFIEIGEKLRTDFDIKKMKKIPNDFKLEKDEWVQVDEVVCVYFDLSSSTKILKDYGDKISVKIFDSYIQSATRIFKNFECSYLDIQGDGGFALFSGDRYIQRAMVSAITLKTLLSRSYAGNLNDLVKKMKSKINLCSKIGAHIGKILAKKSGIRGENEILWLGGLVSVASKICGLKRENAELFKGDLGEKIKSDILKISEDLYQEILQLNCSDYLMKSCNCGNKVGLWEELEFKHNFYEVDKIYILETKWCEKCGDTFSKAILEDKNRIEEENRLVERGLC